MARPDLDRHVHQLMMTDKRTILTALGAGVKNNGRQWATANAIRLLAGFER